VSARGAQRREQLVDAAAALLGREGPASVSARVVAAEAGVPLAAVTYYFEGVDDLVRAGAERLYEGYLDAAVRRVADSAGREAEAADPRACAELLVRVWLDPSDDGPDPRRVRHLLTALASAADNPALAPQLRRYDRALADLARDVLLRHGRAADRARVLLAALDGFALARLSGLDVAGGERGPTREPDPDPAGRVSAADGLGAPALLAGLTADLLLVLDDLAPSQNSRAVGSSRPDSAT
jgi:DNA-binding transcriptional regulator YbjK